MNRRKTGTGGRPGKGDRDLLATRVPLELGNAIRDEAEAYGLTLTDYLGTVLASYHGFDELGQLPHRRRAAEELPMTG